MSIMHSFENTLGKHTMFSEKLFLWLQSGPGSQQGAGTKSSLSYHLKK